VGEIKAIETRYKGYRFRSRLEARWAVFFDTLGIEWVYEKEGYSLGEVGPYLPDFWLPQVDMWAEVKASDLTGDEEAKCRALVEATGHECLLLVGLPEKREYWAFIPDDYGFPEDGDPRGNVLDYALVSMYVSDERRFWSSPGCEGVRCAQDFDFGADYERAVGAARAARFEFGEGGR
jgi:hypothetical protein